MRCNFKRAFFWKHLFLDFYSGLFSKNQIWLKMFNIFALIKNCYLNYLKSLEIWLMFLFISQKDENSLKIASGLIVQIHCFERNLSKDAHSVDFSMLFFFIYFFCFVLIWKHFQNCSNFLLSIRNYMIVILKTKI